MRLFKATSLSIIFLISTFTFFRLPAFAGSPAVPKNLRTTSSASVTATLPYVLPSLRPTGLHNPVGSSESILPPSGAFVNLAEVDASILLDIRYAGPNNFVGRKIEGYSAPKCVLTRQAADALKKVQRELSKEKQTLRIYDCYRPRKAVQDFLAWFKEPDALTQKETYYPHIEKKTLFRDSYLSSKSAHSRGSTVDLTIDGLDMGTPFDFFDPLSHTLNAEISPLQKENRLYLKRKMEKAGFKNLPTEWWHYTLVSEPFSEDSFDFDIR